MSDPSPTVAAPAVGRRRTVWIDVSNTLAVDYVTGFQRLTRELLGRLQARDGTVAYVPVRWCTECGTFLRLSDAEQRRIDEFVPRETPLRSRLSELADPLPKPVKTLGRALLRTGPVHALREELARRRRIKHHPPDHADRRLDSFPPDSWFLDLESAWHNVPHRDVLLPWLHERGVRTSTLIADVIPTQFPEWFDEDQIRIFTTFVDAHLRHSERFVCISECSRRDLLELVDRRGITRPIETSVITMGANFRRAPVDVPRPLEAPAGRYLLSVATVEPRKNHRLLIDAFDLLKGRYDDLAVVFVGKPGWMTEDLQRDMRNHPDWGRRLLWLDKVGDDLLDALYRHAFLAVQPAFYEGFGTPVIEALANGVPALSSNGGAMPEAGGEWAEYFDPHSVDQLVALLERHLSDAEYHEARRVALAEYRPATWEDGAEGLAAVFEADAPT